MYHVHKKKQTLYFQNKTASSFDYDISQGLDVFCRVKFYLRFACQAHFCKYLIPAKQVTQSNWSHEAMTLSIITLKVQREMLDQVARRRIYSDTYLTDKIWGRKSHRKKRISWSPEIKAQGGAESDSYDKNPPSVVCSLFPFLCTTERNSFNFLPFLHDLVRNNLFSPANLMITSKSSSAGETNKESRRKLYRSF